MKWDNLSALVFELSRLIVKIISFIFTFAWTKVFHYFSSFYKITYQNWKSQNIYFVWTKRHLIDLHKLLLKMIPFYMSDVIIHYSFLVWPSIEYHVFAKDLLCSVGISKKLSVNYWIMGCFLLDFSLKRQSLFAQIQLFRSKSVETYAQFINQSQAIFYFRFGFIL